ncbi:hypothetical protein DL95DRAFT_413729 [Leptodontidium sp. 2 PMI_412]|nr:hypothetical protein DL95DRAFT_413729 [Leptodontidium sp. 2 PMI_412]
MLARLLVSGLVVVLEMLLILEAKLADGAVDLVLGLIVCYQGVNGTEVDKADLAFVYVLVLSTMRAFNSLLMFLCLTMGIQGFRASEFAVAAPAVVFGHLERSRREFRRLILSRKRVEDDQIKGEAAQKREMM